MSVGTFLQPNAESQDGTTYKAAIDNSIQVLSRLAGIFAPHAQAIPDMTVRVDAGAILVQGALTEKAAQNTGTIAAPSVHPRIDRLVLDAATGIIAVVTGAESETPSPPDIPSGYLPLAQISLVVSQTAISNQNLTDERASTDATAVALDYLVTDPASKDPGHFHTQDSLDMGVLYPKPALGLAGIQAKVAEADGEHRFMIFTPGDYAIDADYEIPGNIHPYSDPGSILEIANGVTLTLPDQAAGDYPVFRCLGTGKVIFKRAQVIDSVWWEEADLNTSIQKAIYAAKATPAIAGDKAFPIVEFPAEAVQINDPLDANYIETLHLRGTATGQYLNNSTVLYGNTGDLTAILESVGTRLILENVVFSTYGCATPSGISILMGFSDVSGYASNGSCLRNIHIEMVHGMTQNGGLGCIGIFNKSGENISYYAPFRIYADLPMYLGATADTSWMGGTATIAPQNANFGSMSCNHQTFSGNCCLSSSGAFGLAVHSSNNLDLGSTYFGRYADVLGGAPLLVKDSTVLTWAGQAEGYDQLLINKGIIRQAKINAKLDANSHSLPLITLNYEITDSEITVQLAVDTAVRRFAAATSGPGGYSYGSTFSCSNWGIADVASIEPVTPLLETMINFTLKLRDSYKTYGAPVIVDGLTGNVGIGISPLGRFHICTPAGSHCLVIIEAPADRYSQLAFKSGGAYKWVWQSMGSGESHRLGLYESTLLVETQSWYQDGTVKFGSKVGFGLVPTVGQVESHKWSGLYDNTSISGRFGDITGGYDVYFQRHCINGGYGQDTDVAHLWLNYRGFEGGITRFRDLYIGDGKGGQVAFIDGSLGTLAVVGNISTQKQLVSSVAIGTAPLIVTSTTLVSNLNADLLDGQSGSYYLPAGVYISTDSIDPGHKHSKLWASDGSPEAVTVNADGNVGVGSVGSGTYKFEVVGPANTIARFTDNVNATVDISTPSPGLALIKGTVGSELRLGANNLEVVRMTLGGNVGINTDAFGDALAKGLGMGSGTAPTTFPADMAQMCVKDQVAGNACFHFFTELGQIIKLYQQAHIADAKTDYTTGNLDTEAEIISAFNTTNGKINSLYAYLENLGYIATS